MHADLCQCLVLSRLGGPPLPSCTRTPLKFQWRRCVTRGRATSCHTLRCTFLYVLSQRGLTPAQLEQFRQDGILAIPGWLDAPTVESLKAACNKLLDDFSPESVPRSIFSTEEQSRTSDRYFLESGDKVSYFYEQKAFSTDGSLLYEPRATINKVGHDLHTKIAEFRDVSLSPSIAAACRSLGYIHPLVVQVRSDLTQPVLLTTREKQRILVSQSMAIFKPPKIGGAVSPHVDGAFLYTEPQSCVG